MADALFSKVQQRVLGVLFGNPERSFYANEIIGLVSSGTGAVQRELARLEASGLVRSHRVGRQKHFQANDRSPLFGEIRTLALKTFGLADVLVEALEPFSDQIHAAFIYGSVAKGKDHAGSDVDVLILSDSLSYADLLQALAKTTKRIGRDIEPRIYSRREFAEKRKQGSSFIDRILNQPKLWLMGDERDLTS